MRKAKLATGQQEQQTQHTDTKNNATQKEALVNITTDTFQKSRLRERTSDRAAWFGRLVRHPARKRSVSILTTPEPARGFGPRTAKSQPIWIKFCTHLL